MLEVPKNTEIEVGDVVRLKSGSPKMTVVSCDSKVTSYITCGWFDVSLSSYNTLDCYKEAVVNGKSKD